jgi:DNA segregation ATPase FtsK/SpoIIIE, S-DNA-T family
LPARISFQVASRTDSRVVLDEMGADKLLGNGDMLFLWPGTSTLLRGQGTYLSDDEINAVVDHCSTGEQNFVNELVNLKVKEEEGEEPKLNMLKKRDELYAAAVEIVIREGRGSVSLLQRALGIGYGRAARLVDFMAEDGIVGNYAGSQAREVVISLAEWEAMRDGGEVSSSAPPPPASRKNRILPRDEHWEEEQNAEPSETATPTRKSLKVKPVAAATAENDDDQDEDVEWEDVDDEAEYEDD